MLSIEIGCTSLVVVLTSDTKEKGSDSFIVIMIGAIVGYIIASYFIQEILNRRFSTKQNNKRASYHYNQVVIAIRQHLFPFRIEKLSPQNADGTAEMWESR